jgi:glycosyltransferase involved in cell wall biosynthesis
MCYNQEKYIKECLDSIFMQKVNFPVEVVVGDDFSSDRTLDIIRSYKDTDYIKLNILERVKGDTYWENRQTRGRLYNYLDILRNCSGEYIALMDGDDFWKSPYKLAKQVDFLEKNPEYAMVSHEVHTSKFSAKNTSSSALNILKHNFRYSGYKALGNALAKILLDNKEFWNLRVSHGGGYRVNPYSFESLINEKHFMATSSIMFRGNIVSRIGDCFTNTNGGHYFIVMLCLTVGKGFHIPEFLGFHRLHPQSISQSKNKDLLTPKIQAANRINRFKCIKTTVESDNLKKLIDQRIAELESIA